ncbi:MAG: hypothetical protein HY287_07850 [Planctomycetes bacterium]|nr:hypothetical protein [Planctomycetota bacterium]MBI3834225.1 hypothetical protein [Planctomycetota bacterium]
MRTEARRAIIYITIALGVTVILPLGLYYWRSQPAEKEIAAFHPLAAC